MRGSGLMMKLENGLGELSDGLLAFDHPWVDESRELKLKRKSSRKKNKRVFLSGTISRIIINPCLWWWISVKISENLCLSSSKRSNSGKHLSEMVQWAPITDQAEGSNIMRWPISPFRHKTQQFRSSLVLSGEMQMPCIILTEQT